MNGRSPGTVTLGFGRHHETSRTGWPINSHAAVSSVNTSLRRRASVNARRMTSTRNVCGVCTAHNFERSSVRFNRTGRRRIP